MKIEISSRGQTRLNKSGKTLYVELELYFSCLLRKRVIFHETVIDDGLEVKTGIENLCIQFRPVMTKACLVGDSDVHDPQVERFPIVNAERFYPKWVRLDYTRGKWTGDFGYTDSHS